MDRFASTGYSLLERRRADIAKIAMTAFPIIKTLKVFKYIRSSFVSISVAHTVHSLSFHHAKKGEQISCDDERLLPLVIAAT